MAAALQDPSRTVVLAVGAKETSDTILLWRYCNAHILEHETDKVIVVHVRSASALPTSWAPLNMALSFPDGACVMRFLSPLSSRSTPRPSLPALHQRLDGSRRRCGWASSAAPPPSTGS
jgi:hypothetical protein